MPIARATSAVGRLRENILLAAFVAGVKSLAVVAAPGEITHRHATTTAIAVATAEVRFRNHAALFQAARCPWAIMYKSHVSTTCISPALSSLRWCLGRVSKEVAFAAPFPAVCLSAVSGFCDGGVDGAAWASGATWQRNKHDGSGSRQALWEKAMMLVPGDVIAKVRRCRDDEHRINK